MGKYPIQQARNSNVGERSRQKRVFKMKILLTILIVLVGCDNTTEVVKAYENTSRSYQELTKEIDFLKSDIRGLRSQIDTLSLNKQATIHLNECVAFDLSSKIDSHKVGDEFGKYTVPVTGDYYIENRIGEFICPLTAGDVVFPKRLKNKFCKTKTDKNIQYRRGSYIDCRS